MVEAPPSLFDFTLLKGKVNNFSAPTFSPLGGFVNYNLNAYRTQERTMTSGMLELGGFNNRDAAQTNILWKGLDQQVRAIRLDSTWARDQPKQFTRLRFGDVISGASTWGGECVWAVCSGRLIFPSSLTSFLSRCLRCLVKWHYLPR